MYFLDLAKIVLRNNINLSEITDNDISTVINDEQFQTLNIKGAEVFFLLEAMKRLQSVMSFDGEETAIFKSRCKPFVTRVCNLSFNTYDQIDIDLFADFLYYHTMYFEYFSKIPESMMLQDISDLESKIDDYTEYAVDHDAIWLAVEILKIMLIRLYDINFSILEDKNKPMEVIESVDSTMAERRALQRTITNEIKIES